MRHVLLLGVAVMVGLVISACGGGTTPEPTGPQADDPVLLAGMEIYAERCARCHGSAGGGGAAPGLSGERLKERFPDPSDQEEIVRHGRGAMPAHDRVLDDDEIEAVVAYTREVL